MLTDCTGGNQDRSSPPVVGSIDLFGAAVEFFKCILSRKAEPAGFNDWGWQR
jgi:hypothetical protein